jgi:hypothetical protein
METIVKRLDHLNVKHLYSQLYKIRAEYIKNDLAIVSKNEISSIQYSIVYLS